jgi:hypothetical protein
LEKTPLSPLGVKEVSSNLIKKLKIKENLIFILQKNEQVGMDM